MAHQLFADKLKEAAEAADKARTALRQKDIRSSDLAKHEAALTAYADLLDIQRKSDDADELMKAFATPGITRWENGQPVDDGFAYYANSDQPSYSAWTPDGKRAMASALANQIGRRGSLGGAKSLLPAGDIVAQVPFLPSDPLKKESVAPSLLALLPVIRVPAEAGGLFSFIRQSVRTNLAAPVAVGAVKPTSVFSLEKLTGNLEVVAHLSEVIDRFVLEDHRGLETFVNSELVDGISLAVEDQVLNGTGISPELPGILLANGHQNQAAVGTDIFATVRTGITAAETAGHGSNLVIVMSPASWQRFELSRTDTAGNLEMLPNGPVDSATRRLFGIPVVVTLAALPTGHALIIDRSCLAVYTDGRGIRVDWTIAQPDGFSRNQLQARCEARYSVAVHQSLGIVDCALPAAG